jgi:hypothetical protein
VKKATIIIGFLTGLSITTAELVKFTHLPGARVMLYTTGLLLSVFFALFILDKMKETDGRTFPSHIAAALSAMFTDLGITFRINHWAGADMFLITGLLCFSLLFIPLIFIQRSREGGTNNARNAAGAMGLISFGLGTLFKLEHWPGAALLLSLLPAFLFLVYFPMYIADKSIDPEKKHKYLRNSFFAITIGSLIALYFIKSIEVHDMDKVPENVWYNKVMTENQPFGH